MCTHSCSLAVSETGHIIQPMNTAKLIIEGIVWKMLIHNVMYMRERGLGSERAHHTNTHAHAQSPSFVMLHTKRKSVSTFN